MTQTNLKKNNVFFERVLKIIEFKGIKSVNEFSLKYLKYNSSEKINRLKDPENKPSFDILNDISNSFEEINSEWLLTGKGEMLRDNAIKHIAIQDKSCTSCEEKDILIQSQKETISAQKQAIKALEQNVAFLESEISKLEDLHKSNSENKNTPK